jgi:hypothetical protein
MVIFIIMVFILMISILQLWVVIRSDSEKKINIEKYVNLLKERVVATL